MTTSLAAASFGLAALIDAWESSLRAVSELGRRLSPQQWAASTECPGWSVADIVAHTCWIEARMVGRDEPAHLPEWEDLPHAQSELQRTIETGVDVRRGVPQADLCTELDGLIDVRLAMIMALDPLRLDTLVASPLGGERPLEYVLRRRCFDIWTHEQDIRRAVGLPANLGSPGAQVAALQFARAIPFILARNLGSPVGTTLRVTVTGRVGFETWAGIDDDGQGIALDALTVSGQSPSLAMTTDWETYARLGAGRLDTTDPSVLALITLEGDLELGARLPEALAITP